MPDTSNTLDLSGGEVWRSLRKNLSPTFTSGKLKGSSYYDNGKNMFTLLLFIDHTDYSNDGTNGRSRRGYDELYTERIEKE